MRMKRKYVGILVVVGVLLLLAAMMPWIDGIMFKKTYLNLLTSLDDNEQPQIQVLDYRVGWFSSDAKIHMNFSGTTGRIEDGVTFEQHISHGPYALDPVQNTRRLAQAIISTVVHLSPQLELLLLGNQAGQGILQMTTVASFSDNFSSYLQIPPVNVSFMQQKLITQGITGTTSIDFADPVIARTSSNFNLGSFNVQTPTSSFLAEGMMTQGDSSCQTLKQCEAKGSLTIANITQAELDGSGFKISNFGLNAAHSLSEKDLYSSSIQVTAAKLATIKLFNPDYIVGPLNIKFATTDLNFKAIENFANEVKLTKTNINNDKILNVLPSVITATSKITEETSLDTSLGKLTSTLKIAWPTNAKLPVTMADVRNNITIQMQTQATMALIDKLVADIDDYQQRKAGPVFVVASTPEPVAESSKAESLILVWQQQKEITEAEAKDLIALHKLGLSPEIYALSIDKVVKEKKLPAALAEELKKEYLKQATASAEAAQTIMKKAPAVGQVKSQLDSYIKQGYIKQENNQYVINVVYEKGILKINNVVIALTDTMPVPTTTTAAPRTSTTTTKIAPSTSTPITTVAPTP